jgi:site-specific DNA-methyltransferase (adenine-specific)
MKCSNRQAGRRKCRAVWTSGCGQVELRCCDAFDLLTDARGASCVLTDPPYGTTDCEWDTVPDLDKLREAVAGCSQETANLVIFAAQPFSTDLISAWRPWFRYDLIWEKSMAVGFLDANRRPLRAHEHILIFGRKKAAAVYVPQMTEGTPYKARSGRE